jgi:hypothetical protein
MEALALGAASSSCSYAAVALARSLFRKGENFTADAVPIRRLAGGPDLRVSPLIGYVPNPTTTSRDSAKRADMDDEIPF